MTTPRPIFTKKLTKTDVGKRGPDGKKSNQSGVGVSKKDVASFPFLDPAALNPEVPLTAIDTNGEKLDLRYIYFNGRLHGENSRNEYRITGLGAYLREHAADVDDQFTMRPMPDGSYTLSLGSDAATTDGEYPPNEDPPESERPKRATTSRSREMWIAALYLSRFGNPVRGSIDPPLRLNVGSWAEAYARFFESTGDGRTAEQFRRSLKNARDLFDGHFEESGRTGWRQDDSGRTPQAIGGLALEVWEIWGQRTEGELWDEITRILSSSESTPVIINADDSDEDTDEAPDDDPFRRVMQSIRQRRGQARFRQNLLRMYQSECAISGHGPDDVLEAAHIEPHSIAGHNSSDNGILLRADIHTLMDAGLILINPENLRVMIHVDLMNTPYEEYMNVKLSEPKFGAGPKTEYLQQRFDQVSAGSRMKYLPISSTN